MDRDDTDRSKRDESNDGQKKNPAIDAAEGCLHGVVFPGNH
jgi:hypothetical protein